MAVTHVNQGTGDGSGTSSATVTMDANTTVGNLLVMYIVMSNENRTISSVSGAATWTEGHSRQSQVGIGGVVIYAGKCTSATTSITVTISGNSALFQVWVREFNASASTFAETGTSTAINTTAATDFTIASITPGASPCVFAGVLSLSGSGAPWTDDADFTYFASTNALRMAYRIQTDTTAQSWLNTSSSSINGIGQLVCYEASDPAAGGGSKPKTLLLIGCG